MKRALAVLAVLGVVLVSAIGVGRVWLASTVPPLGGRAAVPGLDDSVVVLWDSLAVPHVVAASDADLFTVVGYLHARDRLWQMDLLRHAALGRLSELFGARTLEDDRFLRALEIHRLAETRLATVAPESRRVLEAYARGVNAWLATGHRPIEHRLLGHAAEPWQPVHSVAIGLLQAWDLRATGDEWALAEVVARLGEERARDLVPEWPDTAPIIVSGPTAARRDVRDRPVAPLVRRGWGGGSGGPAAPSAGAGSNAWAIGPGRTRSGRPILANDPHLPLTAPGTWYLLGAHAPDYEVVGATIPGTPPVVLGHTRRVAWGFTNGMVDDLDWVVEELSADSSRVRTPRGWAEVEVVVDTVRVRGAEPVILQRRRTPHGSLVPVGDSGTPPLTLRWVPQDGVGDEVRALLGMARAAGWRDFAAAAEHFGSPTESVVFAAADGTIGYLVAGRVPVRRGGDGTLPTLGWTEAGRWERYLGSGELPRVVDPPAGWIVSANNRIAGDWFPHFLSRHWEPPYRAQRIVELVSADTPATAASVASAQLDVVDVFARATKGRAAAAAAAVARPDVAQRLEAWDGRMDRHAVEPTVFWTWYRQLQRLTYADESPDLQPALPLHRWLAEGRSVWFDDQRTPTVETLDTLARRAMETTLGRIGVVRWGAVHATTLRHPLARLPLLGALVGFAVGPLEADGGNYTVNASQSASDAPPYRTTFASSLRHVVDFGDVDGAGGFMLPAGQSGHPASPHYRDQLPRWQRGDLWVVPLDVRRLRPRDTLRLVPAL